MNWFVQIRPILFAALCSPNVAIAETAEDEDVRIEEHEFTFYRAGIGSRRVAANRFRVARELLAARHRDLALAV